MATVATRQTRPHIIQIICHLLSTAFNSHLPDLSQEHAEGALWQRVSFSDLVGQGGQKANGPDCRAELAGLGILGDSHQGLKIAGVFVLGPGLAVELEKFFPLAGEIDYRACRPLPVFNRRISQR